MTPAEAFAAHQQFLLSFAARFAGREAAEDAVSAMWCKAIASWDSFRQRNGCSRRTWLATIARNEWRQEQRKRSVRIEGTHWRCELTDAVASFVPTVHRDIESRQLAALCAAVLSPAQRSLVWEWADRDTGRATIAGQQRQMTTTEKVTVTRGLQKIRSRVGVA